MLCDHSLWTVLEPTTLDQLLARLGGCCQNCDYCLLLTVGSIWWFFKINLGGHSCNPSKSSTGHIGILYIGIQPGIQQVVHPSSHCPLKEVALFAHAVFPKPDLMKSWAENNMLSTPSASTLSNKYHTDLICLNILFPTLEWENTFLFMSSYCIMVAQCPPRDMYENLEFLFENFQKSQQAVVVLLQLSSSFWYVMAA